MPLTLSFPFRPLLSYHVNAGLRADVCTGRRMRSDHYATIQTSRKVAHPTGSGKGHVRELNLTAETSGYLSKICGVEAKLEPGSTIGLLVENQEDIQPAKKKRMTQRKW